MDEPYSPESIEILDQLEEASVKSELPETGDEPKDKSANLKNYGELTVASYFAIAKVNILTAASYFVSFFPKYR